MAEATRKHSGSGLGGWGSCAATGLLEDRNPRTWETGKEQEARRRTAGAREWAAEWHGDRHPPAPPADSDSPVTVTAETLAPGWRTGRAQAGDRAAGA